MWEKNYVPQYQLGKERKLIQCWHKRRTRTDDICNNKYENTASFHQKKAGRFSSDLGVSWEETASVTLVITQWAKKTSPTVNIPFSFLLAKSIFCSFELNQIIMWSDKYHGEGKVRLSCRREGRRNAFLSGEELLIQPSHLMEIQPQDLLPKPLQRRAKLVLPCLEQGRAGFAQTFVGLNCRGCRILYPAVLFSW